MTIVGGGGIAEVLLRLLERIDDVNAAFGKEMSEKQEAQVAIAASLLGGFRVEPCALDRQRGLTHLGQDHVDRQALGDAIGP